MFEIEHPWLKVDGKASDKPIDSAVLIRLKQFRAMNKMKKLALKVTVSEMLRNNCHIVPDLQKIMISTQCRRGCKY